MLHFHWQVTGVWATEMKPSFSYQVGDYIVDRNGK